MKIDKNVELAAAELLLDRGAAFHMPAPYFLKLLGKRQIKLVIRQPRLGQLLYLTDLPDVRGGKKQEKQLITEENIDKTCRAVAALLLSKKWKVKLFRSPLARHIKKHMSAYQLQKLVIMIHLYGRGEDFISTIKLLSAMRMTLPWNLSHEEKRS
ncbi:MAG TPA: hypothetical protein PK785_00950 [Bacteroidales bacterium]|jgi:hypothetical protein|nr:hypothetical protein [Bacteroidales bacterium]